MRSLPFSQTGTVEAERPAASRNEAAAEQVYVADTAGQELLCRGTVFYTWTHLFPGTITVLTRRWLISTRGVLWSWLNK